MISQDPILKRNFKFEKRKKQRQQQKRRIQQQQQRQQQKLKQLRKIQKQVQQNIQILYQQQKQKILSQYNNKTKSIFKKQNNLLNAFKKNNQNDKQKQQQILMKKQQQLYKNIQKYSFKQLQSIEYKKQIFQKHYKSKLPQIISNYMIKQKVQSATKKLQKQIKKQIQSMFKVKKLQDNQNQQQPIKKINNRLTQSQKMQEQFMNQDPQDNKPYILQRVVKKQKQIIINNHLFTVTTLVQQQSDELFQKTNITSNRKQLKSNKSIFEDLQTIQEIVNNYIDYIHIQNNEQQSIQQFRQIVIRHMYQNQLSCFQALKNDKKSKGFTNAKYLILTPYIGDARAIFDIIQETFIPQTQSINDWTIQNKSKIQQQTDDQNDFFRVGIKIFSKKRKLYTFLILIQLISLQLHRLGLNLSSVEMAKNKIHSYHLYKYCILIVLVLL